ncbi:hypothetical protein LWI28_013674 [Acer negundo]|uniref:Uncharacterized protein n=1 Tax=Acer negundo TaxID=4023 RepID=A0AAD5NJ31_ACENE|nr:hypothetical protein LWI28_013674 [Acer negundo]KAK4838355.1 hypothetical protein QYF36_013125 [Acer negundo]
MERKAPALPESLKLYKKLLSLKIKVVFLTGRAEEQRIVTTNNLKKFGFLTWEKLILKESYYSGKTAVAYKSNERKKLEKNGYRIVGNIGDQWSDLLGTNAAPISPYPSQQISRALLSPVNHTIECRLEDEDVDEEALEVAEALLLKNLLNFSPSVADVVLPAPTTINASNFPQELVKDSRQQQKRKKSSMESSFEQIANLGMKEIDDYFDEIEQKYQDQGEKDDTEKKEDEDEENNDEEAVEEYDEEFSDDGDYNKNEDFDDDEDDFHMNDDDNDEPMH